MDPIFQNMHVIQTDNEKQLEFAPHTKNQHFLPEKRVSSFGDKPKKKVTFSDENYLDLETVKEIPGQQTSFDQIAKFAEKMHATRWTKEAHDALTNPLLQGTAAYLSDEHFSLVMKMLAKKFDGKIGGLNETTLYSTVGFPPVCSKENFLQPIHVGDHWVLLTNWLIPPDDRKENLIIFDSLVRLEKNNKYRCEILPGIKWQAVQLMKKSLKEEKKTNLTLQTFPCQQQDNSIDCGLYCIANLISLAHDIRPDQVIYTGNLREELLQMFLNETVEPFSHAFVDDRQKRKIMTAECSFQGFPMRVAIEQMYQIIDLVCNCNFPLSRSNEIVCDQCDKSFHQCCYLIDMNNHERIGEIIPFVCYACRTPGDYSFQFTKSQVNPQKIKEAAAAILNISSTKLGNWVREVQLFRGKTLIQTLNQYEQLEKLMAKYDINSVAKKEGEIYTSLYNMYMKNVKDTNIQTCFDDFNTCELVHLSVLVVSFAMKEDVALFQVSTQNRGDNPEVQLLFDANSIEHEIDQVEEQMIELKQSSLAPNIMKKEKHHLDKRLTCIHDNVLSLLKTSCQKPDKAFMQLNCLYKKILILCDLMDDCNEN